MKMRGANLPKCFSFLAALGAASCLAGSAAAQPRNSFDPDDWREQASEHEIEAAWPSHAAPEVHAARVVLRCATDLDAAPRDCKVLEGGPAGQGFDVAALDLARRYRAKRKGLRQIDLAIQFVAPGFQPPTWLKKPTEEDIFTVWPERAQRQGVGGKATLSCKVSILGALFDCRAVDESPANSGFGGAALLLAPQFLLKPATLNGEPVVSDVRMPILFTYPEGMRAVTTRSRAALAPDLDPSSNVVGALRTWDAAPSYADVVAAYPERARASNRGGHVSLVCRLAGDRTLSACETTSEEPHGIGLAPAAKALAKKFRAPPPQLDSQMKSGVLVQLAVTFAPEMLTPGKLLTGKPKWTALPNAAAVQDVFPAKAKAAGVSTGSAIVVCDVLPAGDLGCRLESEEPAGLGFGDAALTMTPYFRLATWTAEGLPIVGGKIRMPIRFVDDAAPAPASSPPKAP